MKMPTSCVQSCMRAVSPSRNRLKPRGEASFRRYANTGNLVDFFRYLQSLAYSSKAHVMAIVSSDTFSLSLRDVIYRYQSSAINGLWFEMLMMAANGADHGRVADAADLDWIMFVCVLILQSLSINKFTSPTVTPSVLLPINEATSVSFGCHIIIFHVRSYRSVRLPKCPSVERVRNPGKAYNAGNIP